MSTLARTLLTYSARSAIIGSTSLAQRAGTQQARSATPSNSKATHAKVILSSRAERNQARSKCRPLPPKSKAHEVADYFLGI